MNKIQHTDWMETLAAVSINHQYGMRHNADMNRLKFTQESEKNKTLKLMKSYGFTVDDNGTIAIEPGLKGLVEKSIAADYINKHRKINQDIGIKEEDLVPGLASLATQNEMVNSNDNFISLANPHLDKLRSSFPHVADKVERLVGSADFINTAGTEVLSSTDVKKLVNIAAADIISHNMEDFNKLSKWANEYTANREPVNHEELYTDLYKLSKVKKETSELFAELDLINSEVKKANKEAALTEESVLGVDKAERRMQQVANQATVDSVPQSLDRNNGKSLSL